MRLPRLYAPGLTQLVLAQFSEPLRQSWQGLINGEQFDQITRWMGEAALAHGVRIHAWSLTPKALRLVASPSDASALSRLVQSIGRRLGAIRRDGPVFQGRFRCALLEQGAWVMPAIIWVETAPVREGLTPVATAWRWSSAPTHAGSDRGLPGPLTFHPDYWSCGNTPFDRQAKHQAALARGLEAAEVIRIDQAVLGQWALGSETFVLGLGDVASRRPSPGRRGRPRKLTAMTPSDIPSETIT